MVGDCRIQGRRRDLAGHCCREVMAGLATACRTGARFVQGRGRHSLGRGPAGMLQKYGCCHFEKMGSFEIDGKRRWVGLLMQSPMSVPDVSLLFALAVAAFEEYGVALMLSPLMLGYVPRGSVPVMTALVSGMLSWEEDEEAECFAANEA